MGAITSPYFINEAGSWWSSCFPVETLGREMVLQICPVYFVLLFSLAQ